MTKDDLELIQSPLTQTHSAEGHTLHIKIYRGPGEPCPCGRGKKFKKCCGAASELH